MADTEYEIGHCLGCDCRGVMIEMSAQLCGPCSCRPDFDDREAEIARLREQVAKLEKVRDLAAEMLTDDMAAYKQVLGERDEARASLKTTDANWAIAARERDTLRALVESHEAVLRAFTPRDADEVSE